MTWWMIRVKCPCCNEIIEVDPDVYGFATCPLSEENFYVNDYIIE